MKLDHRGGCLCGAVRFAVESDPHLVTICFCRFCQQATGSNAMVEPIFDRDAFRLKQGTPRIYDHVSGGSGQAVHVHFCPTCGSKLYLTFDRWPQRLGVYAGAFDDPGWFEISPATTRFIFREEAVRGTMIPPGYEVYDRHAAEPDGTPAAPQVLSEILHLR